MAVATQAPVVERIDHWTLVSSDIERTKRFYTEVLGAGSRDRGTAPGRGGGPVAVTLANTTIDFFAPNEHQPQPSPGGEGQHHCYVIKHEDFDTWRERFAAFGVPLRYGQFGTRMSLMFDDPDGYHFEFTVPLADRDEARQELEARGVQLEN